MGGGVSGVLRQTDIRMDSLVITGHKEGQEGSG